MSSHTRRERIKKILRGTGQNMKAGFMKNFDPTVKGGIANFIAQARNLYGREGRQRRKKFFETGE